MSKENRHLLTNYTYKLQISFVRLRKRSPRCYHWKQGHDIRCTNTTADEIITHIGEKLNPNLIRTDYNAILASNLTKITLDAPLKQNGTINSDSDTYTDWEETINDFIKFDSNGNAVLPTIKELSSVIDSSILLKPAGNIGLAKMQCMLRS